jgi:hypothetical protein
MLRHVKQVPCASSGEFRQRPDPPGRGCKALRLAGYQIGSGQVSDPQAWWATGLGLRAFDDAEEGGVGGTAGGDALDRFLVAVAVGHLHDGG